eukprot:gb/GECG01014690.1/.p1 GENE.gb/GECG01014690.1/~~gb/GECG01014690.1/.p1  ORF type:complete len:588 (+),score=68.43 gb/GECG01014690.1/:1-1764(+)
MESESRGPHKKMKSPQSSRVHTSGERRGRSRSSISPYDPKTKFAGLPSNSGELKVTITGATTLEDSEEYISTVQAHGELAFAGEIYRTTEVSGKIYPKFNETFRFYLPDLEVDEANEISVGLQYQDMRHNNLFGRVSLDLSRFLRMSEPGKEQWHQGWVPLGGESTLRIENLGMKAPETVPAIHVQVQWRGDKEESRESPPLQQQSAGSEHQHQHQHQVERESSSGPESEEASPKPSSGQKSDKAKEQSQTQWDFDELVTQLHNIAGGKSKTTRGAKQTNNTEEVPEPVFRNDPPPDQAHLAPYPTHIQQGSSLRDQSSYQSDFEDVSEGRQRGRKTRGSSRKQTRNTSRSQRSKEDYWRSLATPPANKQRSRSPTRRQKLLEKLRRSRARSQESKRDTSPGKWDSDVKMQREEETLEVGVTGHPKDAIIAHKLEKSTQSIPSSLYRKSSPYLASPAANRRPLNRTTATHATSMRSTTSRKKFRGTQRSKGAKQRHRGTDENVTRAPPDSTSYLTGDARVQPARVRKEPKDVHTLPKEYAELDPGISSEKMSLSLPEESKQKEEPMDVVAAPVRPKTTNHSAVKDYR